MSFIDYFSIDELLKPSVYFKGTISLHPGEMASCIIKNRERSSKSTSTPNLHQTFIENSYMKPISNFFSGKRLSPTAQRVFFEQKYMSPSLVYSNCDINNNELGRRELRFGTQAIIAVLLNHFYPQDEATKLQQEVNEKLTKGDAYDEIESHIKTQLKKRLREMKDVLANGRRSEYFSSVNNAITNIGARNIDTSTMLEDRCTDSQVMLTLLRQLKPLFAAQLNTNEFFESIDYAKFCLLIAALIIKGDGLTPEDYVFVDKYLKAIKEYRKSNPGYTCRIKLVNLEETSQVYSIEDLEKEFERHKIASPKIIHFLEKLDKAEELFRKYGLDITKTPLSTPAGVDAYKRILEAEEKWNTLIAAWEFFPKGHRTSTDESLEEIRNSSSKRPVSEKISRKLKAYEYLEASDYIYKIKGINELAGNIGYVYGSGVIIFEKFLENARTNRVAIDYSTIVILTLDRLVEISKLSRSEIGTGIRAGELSGDAIKVYHDPELIRWHSKMKQHITGTGYNTKTVDTLNGKLDRWIKEGVLKPKARS